MAMMAAGVGASSETKAAERKVKLFVLRLKYLLLLYAIW
jgi:hypothetical protein